MQFDEEIRRLWLSRAGRGVALAALAGVALSGCRTREGEATASATAEAPSSVVLAAAQPQEQPQVLKPASSGEEGKVPAASQRPAVSSERAGSEKVAAATSIAPNTGEGLSVKRLVITHGVKDREPLATESLIAGAEPIFAFAELENRGEEDERIVIVFEHESGQRTGFVELEVPKSQTRWRTWCQTKNIRSPGTWTAIITTKAGVELGRTTFQVTPLA